MKKILIINSKCYKDSRQDGICGRNLKESFDEINYPVFMLGYTSLEGDIKNQIKKDNEFIFYHKNDSKASKFNSIKKIFKPDLDYELVNKLYLEACKIIDQHNIDVVVSIYFPRETFFVLKKIKEKYPHVKTISYEVDSVTNIKENTSKLSPIHKATYNRYKLNVYKYVDEIFVMKSHYQHLLNKYDKGIKNNLYLIDVPILKEIIKHDIKPDDTIDFFYTGYLNKESYSPKPFLELFENNEDKTNWRLHLFTRGNCEELIKEHVQKDKRIIQHGYVEQSVLNEEIAKADFFLSIEDFIRPNAIPSKNFMYFSYGKPVIHFGSLNNIMNKEYISKYPLGITLDTNYDNEMILQFIENNLNKHVEFSSVREIFKMNLPEYSRDFIIENLEVL